MSVVRKTAAGKLPGSMTYVLSDATLDRYGDIIEPDGWDLAWFKENPIALFNHQANVPIGNWKNIRVENNKLMAELDPAPPGTTQLADDVRRLIEANVLRATSVGFRPYEDGIIPIDPANPWSGGTHYTHQELLETSIVSVPANPAALQVARSLNISKDTMSAVFGEPAFDTRRDIVKPGGPAALKRPIEARRHMPDLTLSQQIEDRQTRLNAARDQLLELTRDPEHDLDTANGLNTDIANHEQRLASLKVTEGSLALRTAQHSQQMQVGGAPAIISRRPLDLPEDRPKKRDFLWRAGAVHALARVTNRSIEDILHERYRDDEGAQLIVRGPEWVQRAAVAGATTTAAGWAAELVYQAPGDFLGNLLPDSVFPRLAALGLQLNFGPGAASIKIPSRAATPSIGGSFVAEGAPIPVRRMGLTSITLTPHKVGGMAVFSREIAKYSSPQIEDLIREGITEDTAINIDGLLLDAVAESATRPAGLTNGVTPLTASTAKGYAAILADLGALTAPFYAVNAGRKLALLMNPAQGQQLDFAPGPSGVQFGWTTQFTSRFSVIESTSIAAGKVYMVDAADFVSVSGAAEFDVSEQATIHMEDTAPLNISAAGTPNVVAAPVQSMFQTAQFAIRMLADTTWAMRRQNMVQFMTGVNWGP